MVSPALPGLFFCFAAMALLVFASVSPPAWDKVNFLTTTSANGDTTVFGMLGYCIKGAACSTRNLGYNLQIPGAGNSTLNSTVLHNLTYTLILHPIAGALALLAFLFGIIGVIAASRFCTIMMAFFATIGAVVALVVFVIDMVLWNILRNRLRDAGNTAMLGNANWLTVGAVVSLFLAMCTSVCGSCGRFATGRMAGEKVGDSHLPADYVQRQRDIAVLRESTLRTAPTYDAAYVDPVVVASPRSEYALENGHSANHNHTHQNHTTHHHQNVNLAPSLPPQSTYAAR